ncbi:MFS transporter [Brevibacillus sp. H7]|uniref:MFS transporter n=1 Tax=Brevibacillus sp. H7 TaxID=3349138 RepID=UPI00382316D7
MSRKETHRSHDDLALTGSASVNAKITEKTHTSTSLTALVVTICWFCILSEGYDLGIYGAVLPKLLEYSEWSMTPVQAGAIGSYALIGMLLGAVLVGTLTDLIGRKWTLISCLTLFSVFMGFAAMATSPEMFGLHRFIGGLGLGGVIPTVSALTIEYSPEKRRSLMYAIMYTGYPLGGVLGAILSIYLLNDFGWRFMFWLGVLPILAVPFIIKFLPESINFLMARNRKEEAEKIARRYQISLESIDSTEKESASTANKLTALFTLFSKQHIRATLLFWIAFFNGLLMIYGLNTWLPKMMIKAGYPLGSSLSFLLMLNFTAAIGSLLAGVAADRWGSKRVITLSYILAAVCIALLSIKSSLLAVYALVGVAGFGSIGTTLILNAYISKYFSSTTRATALGWALGFGRLGAISGPILGGLLMSWQLDQAWSFYTFAIPGLIASLAVFLIPKNQEKLI